MPKRIDANQHEIVDTLRKGGATVLILSSLGKGAPDILIGHRGTNHLAEIKDGSKPKSQQKLTPPEAKFFETWRGNVLILRTMDDAIELLNQDEESYVESVL